MNYEYYVSSELAKQKVKELREVNRYAHHIENKEKRKGFTSKITSLFQQKNPTYPKSSKSSFDQCNCQP
jgi:hypothetical protein